MSAHHYTPREMLEKLVSFDTVSDKSNLPLIDFVRSYLTGHGIESLLFHNDEGTKANLYASIGPSGRGGIGLSGHTDVVPVEGQHWSSDPFTLTERNGKLYGRGSCDMKGFVAVCLALVPEMAQKALSAPIHLYLSYDEEVGCTGVVGMIEHIGKSLPIPQAVIVGEPTDMQVADSHKGIQEFTTDITGVAAHSSMIHLGASAIFAAGDILREIAGLRDDMIARGDRSGRFTPPYSTIHVGEIHGGTAINIVPQNCSINWEIRNLPDIDSDEAFHRIDTFARERVLPTLRAVSPDTEIITSKGIGIPPFAPQPGSAAETLALRLAHQNSTIAVSYGTEAGLFQQANIPTIVCGPGSIDQAHKPDEFVSVDQLNQCTAFVRRLIADLSA